MKVSFAKQNLTNYISNIGKNVHLPNKYRNYTIYDEDQVDEILSYGDKAIPYLNKVLQKSKDEKAICETLYIMNRMCDKYPEEIAKSYGYISKFNNSDNPNIQVLLAGVYRKTMVPDGFGPLIRMLEKNIKDEDPKYFDASEEIGGAILDYLA